ncbi:MAG TPA: hypothetical protein DGK91_07630 [Clostridium sp.]|nr:hypothetical protein [Clostridium sp.]
MNKDNIRKLDAEIANALGYNVDSILHEIYIVDDPDECIRIVPHYATNSNAMLLLDWEMRKRGWTIRVDRFCDGSCNVEYKKGVTESIVCARGGGRTEPLARALTAYNALTGNEFSLYVDTDSTEQKDGWEEELGEVEGMVGELADVVHALIGIMQEKRNNDAVLEECESTVKRIKNEIGWGFRD